MHWSWKLDTTWMSLPRVGTLNFASVYAEPSTIARRWLWSSGSQRAPRQPHNSPVKLHKHNFPYYQEKAPGFTRCRVSGLSLPQPELVIAWFSSCALVSDCCLSCFGLSTRNIPCVKGLTAPADSKAQKEVTFCIPCQTFPQENEPETKIICFDIQNLFTSDLLLPSTVGHSGSLKGWTCHQRKGADISKFSSIRVNINYTSNLT